MSTSKKVNIGHNRGVNLKHRLFKTQLFKIKPFKTQLSKNKLRLLFSLFFLVLAAPSAVISYIAYDTIRADALHQHQQTAQSLTLEINNVLNQALIKEEARLDTDYSFLTFEGAPASQFLQRSILSRYPVESHFPGIMGYFQVSANGTFSTPLLPNNTQQANEYGISNQEFTLRKQLALRLHDTLAQNQLIAKRQNEVSYNATTNPQQSQNAYSDGDDAKNETSIGFSNLTPKQSKKPALPQRPKRNEKASIPQFDLDLKNQQLAEYNNAIPTKTENQPSVGNLFKSELEPFRFSYLESGHFIAYRQIWRDGERLIQGAILSVEQFLAHTIKARFERSPLSAFTNLNIRYREKTLVAYANSTANPHANETNKTTKEALLTSQNLPEPFNDLSLHFHITKMPNSESGQLILVMTCLLILALIFGTFAIFRLTYRQSQLAKQHQDFVSSVSHELKTPITSIQMYGEILKQGWLDDTKREQYYDFIASESERLARLISNVLQVSNMSRNSLDLVQRPVKVTTLHKVINSKITSQIKQSGFTTNFIVSADAESKAINIDTDSLIQVLINLIDNAIKYAANSPKQHIDIMINLDSNEQLIISIRDYGIGIPKHEEKKVFELFYRIGNEMTRSAKGTGIGLALVKELTLSMGGNINLIHHDVGTEFQLSFNTL